MAGMDVKSLGGNLDEKLQYILLRSEQGITVEAMVNPKEISFSKGVQWATQGGAGRDFPDMQFTQGDAVKLSLELLFDMYENNADVRTETNKLVGFAMRLPDKHRPPKVTVMFGGSSFFKDGDFNGVVTSVKVRFTMFNSDMMPVRAIATIDLQQAEKVLESGNSPDVAKQRIVKRGETLQLLAESEYKNAGEWRRIADANHIDDPLSIEPGTKLLIPPIL